MKNASTLTPIGRWDRHVDKIIDAYWRNNHAFADSMLDDIARSVRAPSPQPAGEADLLNALDRLIAFCCMERNYTRGAQLCDALAEFNYSNSKQTNSEILLKDRLTMLSLAIKRHRDGVTQAPLVDEHFSFLFGKS